VDIIARTPKPHEARKVCAVIDFVDKTQYGQGRLAAAGSEVLTNYLVNSGQFRVVERQKLSSALGEQQLAQTGLVDTTTAARVGKIVGAKYVIHGVVSNFGVRTETSNIIIHQSKTQVAECTVMVRWIDVETSEVVYSKDGFGTAERSASGSMGMGGGMSYDPSLANDAMQAAIAQMLDAMIDQMD
jgi:curli biogenesis system outer membrane secretion channel CsgG